MPNEAIETLVAQPLPEMIKDLGLAVAAANEAMEKNEKNRTIFVIHTAEIELNIAISLSRGSEFEVGVEGGISGFSVNASYARTYNYKEEASSRIKILLSAKTRQPPA